jgi:hypothetical protein
MHIHEASEDKNREDSRDEEDNTMERSLLSYYGLTMSFARLPK